jgi:predicted CXXCH cytochrome family protein
MLFSSLCCALVLSFAAPAGVQQAASTSSCAVCHGEQGRDLSLGAHVRAGIGCVDCHGGVEGPLDVEGAHAGKLVSLKEPRAIVASCGGCHSNMERMRSYALRTDQASLYAVSQHGKKLAEDPKAEVATCVTCHGAHQVLAVADSRSPVNKQRQVETCGKCHADPELAARHGLEHGMVDAYRASVHGKALLEEGRVASPVCTDCHGSHGAAPPRFDEVGHVCGQCHTVVQRYFQESAHHRAALRGEIEECVSCHGNHGVAEPSAEMLLVRPGSVCLPCHTAESDPARATATAIYEDLKKLDGAIEETERMLTEAAGSGLFIDEEAGYLDDARSLRIRARAITHTLSSAALAELLNRGQAMVQETRERLAVKARTFRDHKIYTALFFVVALLFAGVLQVYRRQMSGAATRRPRP